MMYGKDENLLKNIKIWIIDVDGTLTDGSIYYDDEGKEVKKFSVKDGIIFEIVHQCGMKIVILTGRECKATERRMRDLKPDYLYQGIKDKYQFLKDFMDEKRITKDVLAYIGDDLNDFAAMQLSGFVGCPADSCREVMNIADYISPIKGGYGAVRDIIEHMLRKSGKWEHIISEIYGIDI